MTDPIPIFTKQGNHICNGTEHKQLINFWRKLFTASLIEQYHQLKTNTHTGKIFERIETIKLMRINNRICFG